MRVPLSWLREYVNFDLSAEELADLFSLHSQEVDGIERLGILDGEVVVGEVAEFGPHPNADRLNVAKVDLGNEVVQIVAGAPNPYPGAKIPVILPGGTLAGGRKIGKAKLRGLDSHGMMMSERELGISADHAGILLLDGGYETGRLLSDYFPIGDTVLEIDVMPNRPDLWGMIGVARELSAILHTAFSIPEPRIFSGGPPTADYGLRVEDRDLCPRYDLRRVGNLTPGGITSMEMRRRIHAAGMRPVNGIVDATNYVMLETGQPVHAFDAAKVRGGIVVRRALPGEKLTMLDGHTRALNEEMLVIADEERGLIVAGVMGAEDAEVSKNTTDVLIEVANFAGRNILETSQRLALRTDASGRFERGLDPNTVDYAMERVVGLLCEYSGGSAAEDTLSDYPEPVEPWRVPLRVERAELLLGMAVEESEAVQRLELLGCEVEKSGGRIEAAVPTFRRDLRREADLIEEVGRLVGLGNVPESLPKTALPGGLTPAQGKTRLLRCILAELGLAEAITYPFGPDRWRVDLHLGAEPGIRLQNPLSAEARELRPTLLPGLLDAAARNRAFGARGGAIFEVGHVFRPAVSGEIPHETAIRYRFEGPSSLENELVGEAHLSGVGEETKVGALLFGEIRHKEWNAPEEFAGFFQAKGVVEHFVPGAEFRACTKPFLHPGRAATVLIGGAEAGWIGEVHPEVVERFELEGWPAAAFELDLALCEPDPQPRFRTFVNVPSVAMDLAVVVDQDVEAGEILAEARSLDSPILAGSRVFDVYEGEQVGEGKKSIALAFVFHAGETLTDEQVKAEMDRISARFEKRFGARVRGG